ncbi:17589_t:CDS:2, partial [Racocetra persica]
NVMQTLLNLVVSNSQVNESQAFLNLHNEDTLYNIGEELERPIRSTRLKRQRTTEDLSQEIHPDLQKAPKAPTTARSESSDVCLEDGINEIYNFYFDNVEKVVPEIDI